MVGFIPLFAVRDPGAGAAGALPGFKRRLEWFIENRPDLIDNVACMRTPGMRERRLLSIATQEQLRQVLKYMLDENEFLSPYGIRALSRYHRDHPYHLSVNGTEHRVDYEPAESSTGPVRRQLQLARSDLVSGQFLAHRVAAEVSLLSRRQFQGRVPDRLGKDDDALGGRRGNVPAA